MVSKLMQEQEKDEKNLADEISAQELKLESLIAQREARRAGKAAADGKEYQMQNIDLDENTEILKN